MNVIGGRVLVPRSAVQRIQSMILEGILKPGDRLPAQRELSEQFGISRASLREALSVLETLGLIRVEVGRGVFVLGPDGDGAPQAKWRYADRYSPLEVYETRLMLEPRSAALAARNAKAEDLAAIGQSVERMRAAVEAGDLIAAAECDSIFHRAIVECSGNRMVMELFRTVNGVMDEIQRLPFIHHERIWETVSEHEAIVAALNGRDEAGAAVAMAGHIRAAAGRIGIGLGRDSSFI